MRERDRDSARLRRLPVLGGGAFQGGFSEELSGSAPARIGAWCVHAPPAWEKGREGGVRLEGGGGGGDTNLSSRR